ncbi:MAG TPA: hypothetical protein VIM65_24685 [Cyclobacteriaceae bacterium]
MRLGQLARKLAVRPTEIAEFLSKENIQLEANSNTRIEDDQVIHLVKHFAPDMLEAIKAELTKEEILVPEEEKIEVALVETLAVESQPEVEAVSNQSEEPVVSSVLFSEPVTVVEENNTSLSDEEVIRAPKIELPGLKVLGKIEIPEPKKKEVQPVAEEDAKSSDDAVKQNSVPAKETRSRERRQPQERRKEFKRNDDQRNRRNPVTVQREREAEEARLKKEEAAKLEKERRTLHYMKKVKVVTPAKTSAFIDEPAEVKAVREETPTSLWGRFKKWLKS